MSKEKPEMKENEMKVGTGAIPPKPAVQPRIPTNQPDPSPIKPNKTDDPVKK